MKKFSLLLTALLLAFLAFAQNETDIAGILITKNGERIEMTGDINLTNQWITYHDERDKYQTIRHKNVKWMMVGNRVFLSFPRKQNRNKLRLMEVLAFNENYVLLTYWNEINFFYVYDYNGNALVDGLRVTDTEANIYTGNVHKNNEKAIEAISPYFGNCNKLMDVMRSNVESKQKLTKQISIIRCEGAPEKKELIENFEGKLYPKF